MNEELNIGSTPPPPAYSVRSVTSQSITCEWEIKRKKISQIPSPVQTSYDYTGSIIKPFEGQYDPSEVTATGVVTATDAGDHTAVFTPKKNYCWPDGSVAPVEVDWSVSKVQGTLEIEPTNLEFTDVGATNAQMIVATSNIPGDIEAESGDESVAAVVSSGKIVTVTPVGDGETDITVSISGGVNYLTPASQLCGVSISSKIDSRQLTAAQFQSYIKSGQGPSTFAAGDSVGIPINGNLTALKANTVSTEVPVNLSGTYYAQILGFNHNSPTEGFGNYVDLQFHVSENGDVPLCFCPVGGGYQMNTTPTNVGGPGASFMYTTTLPKLLGFIDSAWKNTFIEVKKYVDTAGNLSNVAVNVEALKSILFLLAEFEVFGVSVYANQYEKDKQKQYDLYANGATIERKFGADHIYSNFWWLSSPASRGGQDNFCCVYEDRLSNMQAFSWNAIAPGFRIGTAA